MLCVARCCIMLLAHVTPLLLVLRLYWRTRGPSDQYPHHCDILLGAQDISHLYLVHPGPLPILKPPLELLILFQIRSYYINSKQTRGL